MRARFEFAVAKGKDVEIAFRVRKVHVFTLAKREAIELFESLEAWL